MLKHCHLRRSMQKSDSGEEKKGETLERHFLKSLCGRVFVNKNGNLHKNACFLTRPTTARENRRIVEVKQSRAERKYLYK